MEQTYHPDFWYKRNDEVVGPVDGAAVRQAALRGIIRPDTLIRKGGSNWVPAKQLKGLFDRQGRPIAHPPDGGSDTSQSREVVATAIAASDSVAPEESRWTLPPVARPAPLKSDPKWPPVGRPATSESDPRWHVADVPVEPSVEPKECLCGFVAVDGGELVWQLGNKSGETITLAELECAFRDASNREISRTTLIVFRVPPASVATRRRPVCATERKACSLELVLRRLQTVDEFAAYDSAALSRFTLRRSVEPLATFDRAMENMTRAN